MTTHTSTSLPGAGVPFTREPNQITRSTSGRLWRAAMPRMIAQ